MWRVITVVVLLVVLVGGVAAQDEPTRIWVTESAPVDLLVSLQPLFDSGRYVWTNNLEEADLALDFEKPGGAVTSRWVYVPVVAFASTAEILRWENVRQYWGGDLQALSYLTPDGSAPTFVTSNETLRAMVSLLGNPAENVPMQFVETTDQIRVGLWQNRPNVWGIVGFNNLTPDLKVLTLDRINVFADDFEVDTYPLTTHIDLKGDEASLGRAMDDLLMLESWQATNRYSDRLSRVVLTGVTALTRAAAFQMEQDGILTPAAGIMPFFADADVLHTSNEVSFSENCPFPDPYGGVIFCSQDEYFELLKYIGLDVVEQTGNHVNDYGPGAMRRSLDMYAANNMGVFGGGYTPEDARDAYLTEVNGTSIAFIGCNVPGPFGAWASETRVGAAQCDDTFLETEIPRLAAENDIVIVAVQEFEYYRYTVGAEQLRRFEQYAAWGADVVIGSQAHQPQGFTFSETGAFLHHGLGNLFFDQMQNIGTRQMFADKLILYDGELISVVLYTGLIEKYCCPRPMTAAERVDFLNTIFLASGW